MTGCAPPPHGDCPGGGGPPGSLSARVATIPADSHDTMVRTPLPDRVQKGANPVARTLASWLDGLLLLTAVMGLESPSLR